MSIQTAPAPHREGPLRLGILGAGQLALMLAVVSPQVLSAATLQGRVTDPTGAAIDAYVFVFDNSKHPRSAESLPGYSAVADGNGHYSFSLSPGFYDVCVFQNGFSASCHKVLLKKDESTLLQNFKMKLDPLTAKELGDRLPSR